VIISASRRTDVPAFYHRWLIRRIQQGFCLVANPFRPTQVTRVSLLPEDVIAIVFWSKNPRPMFGDLDELDQRAYRYYFLVTLNDYPSELEPNLPPLSERIGSFIQLSERLGPRRVIWRYDPILLSNLTGSQYHETHFEGLCRALSGYTERVIISVVDFYRKTTRRLRELESQGILVERVTPAQPEVLALLARLHQIASLYRIDLRSCAEEAALGTVGIEPGSCIDGRLIQQLASPVTTLFDDPTCRDQAPRKKDPGQRLRCQCIASKDIGATDTCIHGCRYCYATQNDALARRRYVEHDPEAPILWSTRI
jgi:hypothetical protein